MYLLDSDAAKKLCQYLLLDELASALGCSLSDFAILPQLKYQLKLTKPAQALRKLGTQDAVDLALRLVDAAAEVEIDAESANPLLDLNRPNIDSGEATLFAAIHSNEDAQLCSGDKRAFVALAEIDGNPVVDALWVRIICLEEAIYTLLQVIEFQVVSDKIRARSDADMAISIAFGRQQANPLDQVLEALQSYLHDLVANTSGKYFMPA